MIRLNISFTDKQARMLERERKKTGVPTSVLIRQLIEAHFKEQADERRTIR